MVRFGPNGRPAWFELPPDPGRLAEICLDGQRSEVDNPALEKLLSVVDDTERLINTKPDPGNCRERGGQGGRVGTSADQTTARSTFGIPDRSNSPT